MSSESFNKCIFEALKSSLADTAVREERALVLNFAHQCCRRGESPEMVRLAMDTIISWADLVKDESRKHDE